MNKIFLLILFVLPLPPPLSSEEKRPDSAGRPSTDAGMVRIGDFYIDKYEYPNRKGSLPKVDISWTQARDLCLAEGKRLCSENEWEKACKGPQSLLYGYGMTFEQGRCNTPFKEGEIWNRGPGATPSGEFARCTNGYGVHDMIGNVWEWTDGWYSREKKWRVVRGGSWFHSVNLARSDVRYGPYLSSDYQLDLIGMRCCRSISKAERKYE